MHVTRPEIRELHPEEEDEDDSLHHHPLVEEPGMSAFLPQRFAMGGAHLT